MEATAKDLRFHAKELLDTVSRGEEGCEGIHQESEKRQILVPCGVSSVDYMGVEAPLPLTRRATDEGCWTLRGSTTQ